MLWRNHLALLLGLTIFAAPGLAQETDRSARMQFAPGASSAVVRGTISGYQGVVYLVGVRAGETLSVSMKANNNSAFFNIFAPRSQEALFKGAISGNRYSGRLTESGDVRVQVYLMRNAARRRERASFTLSVGVGNATAGQECGGIGRSRCRFDAQNRFIDVKAATPGGYGH